MTTGPKLSRGSLDVVNNTYVVRNGLLYEYYPIVVEKDQRGNFLNIEISPGVMMAGTAILGRKLFDVSLRDLLRRKIDVRKQHITTTKRNGTGQVRAQEKESPQAKTNVIPPSEDELRLGEIIGDKVSKIADVAWQNQVHTLLETLHSEEGEEFEVTGTTQSGYTNSGGSISNIFEDID